MFDQLLELDSANSRETYIDCSYIVLNVFEKKFFKRVIYAAIHTSLDSVLDADYGDIIFIATYKYCQNSRQSPINQIYKLLYELHHYIR